MARLTASTRAYVQLALQLLRALPLVVPGSAVAVASNSGTSRCRDSFKQPFAADSPWNMAVVCVLNLTFGFMARITPSQIHHTLN